MSTPTLTELRNARALAWEQEYDAAREVADILIVPKPTDAADRLIADHVSPVDRARAALHRACLDPDEYAGLVREIAKQIGAAEQAILKGSATLARAIVAKPITEAEVAAAVAIGKDR
jgi:hypothetical protein